MKRRAPVAAAVLVALGGGAAALAVLADEEAEPARGPAATLRTQAQQPDDEIDLGDVEVPSRKKRPERESREEEVARLERESRQGDDAPVASAPSDDEVRAELRELRKGGGITEKGMRLNSDGEAEAPPDAPTEVQRVIRAGNVVARAPYRWGGGHGRWLDDGYDCSGSVSFALFSAGLLDSPLNSSGLARWGKPGRGRWITIYANDGHVFMDVGGLRFDTSGRDSRTGGSRWQLDRRPGGAYAVRHWPGL